MPRVCVCVSVCMCVTVIERAAEYRTPVLMCLVDLMKAYDTVDRSALVAVLKSYGVPHQLVDIIQALYSGTWCQVRTADGTSEAFEVRSGTSKARLCPVPPTV